MPRAKQAGKLDDFAQNGTKASVYGAQTASEVDRFARAVIEKHNNSERPASQSLGYHKALDNS